MNGEIGAEAALFPEKEYISGIFVAVYHAALHIHTRTYYIIINNCVSRLMKFAYFLKIIIFVYNL
jgi:hypothetical protein